MAGKIIRKERLTEIMKGVSDEIYESFVTLAAQRSQELLTQNEVSAGGRVDMDWLVSGKAGLPLRAVEPGGRLSFFYNPIQPVVRDAMNMLMRWAPVGNTPLSPKYKKSFIILQDALRGNKEVSAEVKWPGRVDGIYVEILNLQPYAGSLEPHTRARRGPRVSRQAPNGITELVVANLRAKWGSVMKINLVSKQWPETTIGKNPYYHIPTITISPNWKGALGSM